ncbi:response regulator transcription factor [Campylobacterota bacterium]
MDVKTLKQITSELSLLYVEDDDSLRDETAKLFRHLFQNVETAENGQIALNMLLETDYDLIVTDINMPIMDGVKLCQHIREHRPELPVLITSAHDESNYLLELIDIGIDKFILKPLNMSKLISTLSQVCTHIHNKMLLYKYKQDLEASNIQLKSSNEELESLVKILDKKIEQLDASTVQNSSSLPKDAINKISQKPSRPQYNVDFQATKNAQGLLLFTDYIRYDDLQSLHDLQSDIDDVTMILNLKEHIEQKSILDLSKMFNQYGKILLNYSLFSNLAEEIINLAHSMENNNASFIEQINDISILLDSFLYVLHRWKNALFVNGIKSPNLYDASMINDIETIIILLQKEKCVPEKNLEFF